MVRGRALYADVSTHLGRAHLMLRAIVDNPSSPGLAMAVALLILPSSCSRLPLSGNVVVSELGPFILDLAELTASSHLRYDPNS